MNKHELKEEIKLIEKQISELEKTEDDSCYLWNRTKPTDDDIYWFVNFDGFDTGRDWWDGNWKDKERFDMCNVYRNEEEALIFLRKRAILTELRKYACDCNDSGEKWGISYDSKTKTIVVIPLNSVNHSALAFGSKDAAERAIDIVGRERIANYLFGESNKEKIKELEDKLLSLKKELIELTTKEARDAGYWIPNDGATYWYISKYGNIDKAVWDIMREDIDRLSIGNVFRTKKDVEFELERLRVLSIMKPFTCRFRQTDKPLYVIVPTEDGSVTVSTYDFVCLTDTTLYFDSEEKAYAAIEATGENQIRKYLFGIR